MTKNRIFFDIEKERKWLNEMSSNGYRLTNKSCFSYVFEVCEPNKYIYQVEKRSFISKPEDEDYIDFLNNLNIRLINSQFGWFYFEKDNDGKKFEIFTDPSSKIKQYKKLIGALIIIAFFSIVFITNCLTSPPGSRGPYICNLSFPLISNPLIILACIVTCIKYAIQIKKLDKEKNLVE